MNIIAKAHIVFLFSILLAACNSSSKEFPIGVYVDHKGGVIEFREDGTYLVSDSEGKVPTIFGVYVIENNRITLKDNLFYCPDYVGIYFWSVGSDRSLTFEAIDEECEGRGRILDKGLDRLFGME